MISDVRRYYEADFEDNDVLVTIQEVGKNFTVNTTESILLQTFINLLDNATYWLKTIDISQKEIKVLIDKDRKQVIFGDNGPGIDIENQQYIFEPFFSTKGKDGRGLGLYIAKQLLQRYDFDISYISDPEEKILSGSNFLLDFNT